MDSDLALVIGLVVAVLSVPSILSALTDGRAPRASILTIMIGGGLILYAIQNQPGGYAMADLPDVFLSVIARYAP